MMTWKTLAGLVMAVGIAWTIRLQIHRDGNPSLSPSLVRMKCSDQNCGKMSTIKLRDAEDLVCPYCSGRLIPLSICSHCQTELVLAEDLGQSGPTVCHECGKEIRRED